ncbi:hypothetical protein FDA94_09215 [Herbidospora galbida]|uniref:Uncharacterized protein n=1 Tax=Herbidospora galbida TaxID=2575442 RepID=A0A4U3MLB5_9ACTN|nr:hypothetical protein [Herbidospora galbida]TKK89559.1 hypothetical protein FDA94_09215 [Herbidospora galbida]
MTEKLIRTTYVDPTVNPPEPRQGDTGLHESRQDQEGYFEPLHRLHHAAFHGHGVGAGLQVAATPGQPGLRVMPGVALDETGRLIPVTAGGHVRLGDDLIPVTETGAHLPTAGLTGDRYVTVAWGEAFDYSGVAAGVFNTETTPVIRLREATGFAKSADQVVIAGVTFDQGKVTALRGSRQFTAVAADRIDLMRGSVTTSGTESLAGPTAAATLSAWHDGGVILDTPVLVVHHQGGITPMLHLDSVTGRMGVGVTPPAAAFDVEGGAVIRGKVGIGTARPDPAAALDVRGGAIMPTAGSGESAGILFPRDPGGGGGDRAYIRYFPVSGERTRLLIGNDNDADDEITFRQNDADVATIIRRSVGIGTDNPTGKLDVRETRYNTTGVLAISDRGIGLYASGAQAAVFNGDVHIDGRLTGVETSGFSAIDHPLDPAGRFLNHGAVESDELKNVYDGEVTLDEHGAAEIALPDWFEALNEKVRYQLTPLGGPAPNLHVSRRLSGNSFSIAGGEPGAEVCWLVTGVRHDAHARANPLVVETDKSEREHGRYRHPEAHGFDPSLGLWASPASAAAQE